MANHKKTMGLIRQILRLTQEKKSIKSVARSLDVSRNTVRKYLRDIEHRGLSLDALLAMSDEELSGLFDPPVAEGADSFQMRYQDLQDRMTGFEQELLKPGVTRWVLWLEYKAAFANGYNYSQFCYHIQQWQQARNVTMHFDHKAGEKLFVDYTGKKLSIVDVLSGEVQEAEVFVAILGASQYTYVEATHTQGKADFFGALARALHFFGGVPQVIVPDNLKAAVDKPSAYEARLQATAEDFAQYYQTSFMPARAHKPRDKALVENAVRIMYSRIFAPLRNRVFHDLRTLNQAIRELLDEHNRTLMQGLDYSRQDCFTSVEKETLAPLPADIYEIKEFTRAKVQKNAHVLLSADKHYYSVPYMYVGKQVKLAYTTQQVEVFYQLKRIACHLRSYQNHRYTTQADHMPSQHRFIAEWHPDKFIQMGAGIGVETKAYIEAVLHAKAYPEQAYKSCMGILAFARRVGNDRLNKACHRAMAYHSYGYVVIKNILDKHLDEMPLENEAPKQQRLPLHENIRGQQYYQ